MTRPPCHQVRSWNACRPVATAATAEAPGDVAGQRGAGAVGEPVEVVVEDGPGQRDEDALEDQGARRW